MAMKKAETTIDGINISIETGRMAKQASGSTVIRMGDTMVLTTACSGAPREGIDFFPLSVEYIEKTYAAGKIPGGYFKREAKPSEHEILSARVVDRPIRPLFPDGYNAEVQIINTVISADEKHNADILAVASASAALCVSKMPFTEPVAAVRVGMVDGALKAFPTIEETEKGALDLTIAGTADSIMMVEGGSYEIGEDKLIEAIMFAHDYIKKLVDVQKELIAQVDVVKDEYVAPEQAEDYEELKAAVEEVLAGRLHDISFCGNKDERYSGMDALKAEVKEALEEKFPERGGEISKIIHDIEYHDMRSTILETGKRIGGRGCDEVRDINIELDILPRAHGSALFTRGETQALAVSTLGTKQDEQRIDNLQSEYYKDYMLHYNFPPYSVGEVKRVGMTSRREIGHGHLAERSLAPILPAKSSFPYTIRIVSEIMESNGSSSMASICGGSLSLMAAGVPIKEHVAGVAMGLIQEGEKTAILTDILGTEDHMGDMDFKVAGTREGITAIQMDIKIDGITPELMKEALGKANTARLHILDKMDAAIEKSRAELSDHAPSILSITIDKEKIGDIIGPGGKIIRAMQEETETTINVEDDGTVRVFATNKANGQAAMDKIKGLIEEPEVGKVYKAKIKTIVDFGAFAEYLPGRDGLIHISEIDTKRVENVSDYLKEGDDVEVKLIGIDRGKVRLSIKALKEEAATAAE